MKLNKKHQKAIELLFEGSLKRREIAGELNISEQTLYNWLKDEKFTNAYDEYVKMIMGKSSGKALHTMLKLMSARSEMVRFNAAKDILDRSGYTPVNKQQVEISETPLFVDDIGDDDG